MNKLTGVKITFVSRDLPLSNTYGAGVYVMSILSQLQRSGCQIEFMVLGAQNGLPGWIVPASLDQVSRVVADRAVRIGPILLRDLGPSRWAAVLVKQFYLRVLPEGLRHAYRGLKQAFKPNANGLTTGSPKYFPPHLSMPSKEEVAFFLDRYQAFGPDVIIVNYVWLAELLRHVPGPHRSLRAVLTHDVIHQRKSDFEAQGLLPGLGDWDEAVEQALLSNAEIILAIQEHDAQVLRQMLPEREVMCVPIAISVRPTEGISQVPGRCLFVGSYVDHNIVGLKWFLESIWPTILTSDPHASLHVCGGVCRSVTRRFSQVRLLGQLENLDVEYGAAELCVVPLHVGSGLKIKLVQALSYGRVCVSTSVGVQGLPNIDEAGVSVADTPGDFAQAVHELLNDGGKRIHMQQLAQQYVRSMFAPEVVFTPFVNRIAEHIHGQPAPSGR